VYGWDVLDSLMTPLLIALLLVVILVLGLRWFKYKERMAALQRSAAAVEILLDDEPDARRKRQLAYGLTTALVGLALTIGLGTLGIGPWLLAGLVPFFVGLSMILSYLVTQPEKPGQAPPEVVPEPAVLPEAEKEAQPEIEPTAVEEEEEEDQEDLPF
jgi:Na+/H+ antiporter NhaB